MSKALLTVVLLFAISLTPTPASFQVDTWGTVQEFSGTVSTTTQTFSVDRGEWRVRWKTAGPVDSFDFTDFQVYIHKASGEWVHTIRSSEAGEGVTVQRGAGNYYLDVFANTEWSAVIEQR